MVHNRGQGKVGDDHRPPVGVYAGLQRLGIDLGLGDDIAYNLVGHMHPTGLSGTARMVGSRLDPRAGTFEPVLRT